MSVQSNTMNIQVYEILQRVNDLLKTDKSQGLDYLRNNRSRVVIEQYLKMNYDPAIVFQLPAGIPPFKKQMDVPDGYCLTDLKQEFRRMRVFTDAALAISNLRREQLWLQMCEGLFWKEADLINKIKDRRITDVYDQLTVELVREAFPDLLPAAVAEPVPDEVIAPVDFGPDPAVIPVEELIKAGIQEFELEEQQAKKANTEALKGTTNAAPVERKKPGPKPKPKAPEPEIKERKKPGPKPKPKA